MIRRSIFIPCLFLVSLLSITDASACSKNFLGVCSGKCPSSKPNCSTKFDIGGVTCECVKKTKNELSSDAVEAVEVSADPLIEALLDLSTATE